MQTIAFIGLGHMGAPMAANLIKAGYLLRVFDLVQSAIDGLVVQGASAARSAHDAVDGADVVVTMLPASGHVEGLYLGNEGTLPPAPWCWSVPPSPPPRHARSTRLRPSAVFPCSMHRSPAAPAAPSPAP